MRKLSWALSDNLDLGKHICVVAACWEGKADVDYSSIMTIGFNDGNSFLFLKDGTLKAVSCSKCHTYIEDIKNQ